jgi:hypothetical protein
MHVFKKRRPQGTQRMGGQVPQLALACALKPPPAANKAYVPSPSATKPAGKEDADKGTRTENLQTAPPPLGHHELHQD